MRRSPLLLTLLLVFQTVFAQNYDMPARASDLASPTNLTLLPLKSKHYAVEVMINDKGPYKFMIDTGSAVSVISQRLANKLNLTKIKQVKYTRDDKKYNAGLYRIPKMTLNDAQIFDYDVLVYPEPSFIGYMKKSFNEDIDGVLGIGAFYHYLLTLNLPEKELTLHSGELSADKDTKTYQNQEKIPIVSVVFKDPKHSKKMSFVVDTGSNEQFTLPPTVKTLPFKKISSQKILTGSHYGEKAAMKVKITANAMWEDKEFEDPTVVYNTGLYDSNVNFGVMGLGVMKRLKITFDQKKHLVKVE